MQISLPTFLATRAPTVLSRAFAPKTVWGMSIAKAVASLQGDDFLTYEPIKVTFVLVSVYGRHGVSLLLIRVPAVAMHRP